MRWCLKCGRLRSFRHKSTRMSAAVFSDSGGHDEPFQERGISEFSGWSAGTFPVRRQFLQVSTTNSQNAADHRGLIGSHIDVTRRSSTGAGNLRTSVLSPFAVVSSAFRASLAGR